MTLCLSETCDVSRYCKRNERCGRSYRADPQWQSYAMWQPKLGEICEGFIDTREHRP